LTYKFFAVATTIVQP